MPSAVPIPGSSLTSTPPLPLPAAHACTSARTRVYAATCVQEPRVQARGSLPPSCSTPAIKKLSCGFSPRPRSPRLQHHLPARCGQAGLRLSAPSRPGSAWPSPGDPAAWWGWMGPSGAQLMVLAACAVSFLLLSRTHFLVSSLLSVTQGSRLPCDHAGVSPSAPQCRVHPPVPPGSLPDLSP